MNTGDEGLRAVNNLGYYFGLNNTKNGDEVPQLYRSNNISFWCKNNWFPLKKCNQFSLPITVGDDASEQENVAKAPPNCVEKHGKDYYAKNNWLWGGGRTFGYENKWQVVTRIVDCSQETTTVVFARWRDCLLYTSRCV